MQVTPARPNSAAMLLVKPAMAWAIAEHDAALRDAVAGAGGVMYKVIGDGAQIAFADPIAALVAASAALRSFDAIVIEGEDGE